MFFEPLVLWDRDQICEEWLAEVGARLCPWCMSVLFRPAIVTAWRVPSMQRQANLASVRFKTTITLLLLDVGLKCPASVLQTFGVAIVFAPTPLYFLLVPRYTLHSWDFWFWSRLSCFPHWVYSWRYAEVSNGGLILYFSWLCRATTRLNRKSAQF